MYDPNLVQVIQMHDPEPFQSLEHLTPVHFSTPSQHLVELRQTVFPVLVVLQAAVLIPPVAVPHLPVPVRRQLTPAPVPVAVLQLVNWSMETVVPIPHADHVHLST